MPSYEIYKLIEKSIITFLENDEILLKNDANERTITHKLACYLEKNFNDWDVDCEYNRNQFDIKRLKSICNSSKNKNGSTVFPDIIIHKRMSNENFIVIEVKKTTNSQSDECDIKKLEAFRDELKYKHGFFIRFKAGSDDVGIEKIDWVF